MLLGMGEKWMIVWKIEARELAEELLGGCVVGERGVYLRFKAAQITALPIYRYVRQVAIPLGGNPFVPKFGVSPFTSIPVVACPSAGPKIIASIIKSVAVPMVDLARGFDHFFVKPYALTLTVRLRRHSGSIHRAAASFDGVPAVDAKARRVLIVNDRYTTLREGDFSHVA